MPAMATWHPVTLRLTDRWGPLPPHADIRPARRGLRRLERLLLVSGVLLLAFWAYVTIESALYQRFENRELDAILRSAEREPGIGSGIGDQRPGSRAQGVGTTGAGSPIPDPGSPSSAPRVPLPGSSVGRLDIPRLGVSAVVRAGSDARTLRLAVGHIPGTALPGQTGNVGLAGHRDTFFRRLRDIRPGDRIRMVTPDGTFVYTVARTNVVEPTDVWVLDPTDRSVLTLVTCYPFSYIGSAPQRFIVRADLL